MNLFKLLNTILYIIENIDVNDRESVFDIHDIEHLIKDFCNRNSIPFDHVNKKDYRKE